MQLKERKMEETCNGKKNTVRRLKQEGKNTKLQPRNLSKIRNKDGLKGTNC